MTPPVDAADFKARFARDFIFDADTSVGVTDGDITNALNDATLIFNADLWAAGVELETAFLMLSAHFLALNIQAAGGIGLAQGAQNAGGAAINSRSVGSVSVGYDLPEKWKNSSIAAPFLRTDYGMRYFQMAAPRLVGNVAIAAGWNDTFGPTGA